MNPLASRRLRREQQERLARTAEQLREQSAALSRLHREKTKAAESGLSMDYRKVTLKQFLLCEALLQSGPDIDFSSFDAFSRMAEQFPDRDFNEKRQYRDWLNGVQKGELL